MNLISLLGNQPSLLSIKSIYCLLPESILGTEHGEVENMSQELKELTFDSPTSYESPPFVQPLNIEAAQQRQGKRPAKAAELESGSNVVPR